MDYLKHARGDYQRALLTGRQRWSGSDLEGRARAWKSKYHASRAALSARLTAAGHTLTVEPIKSALTGRAIDVLHVDGAPVSAAL